MNYTETKNVMNYIQFEYECNQYVQNNQLTYNNVEYIRMIRRKYLYNIWKCMYNIKTKTKAMIGYNTFLKTDYWNNCKRMVYARDFCTCRICGTPTTDMHVHHLTYWNHFNEMNHLEDLICICSDCHIEQHSTYPLWSFSLPVKYQTKIIMDFNEITIH